jgi:hypothetical protein
VAKFKSVRGYRHNACHSDREATREQMREEIVYEFVL